MLDIGEKDKIQGYSVINVGNEFPKSAQVFEMKATIKT